MKPWYWTAGAALGVLGWEVCVYFLDLIAFVSSMATVGTGTGG